MRQNSRSAIEAVRWFGRTGPSARHGSMGGRYALTSAPAVIAERFRTLWTTEIAPHYNIAPRQMIPVVHETGRGLPRWAKDAHIGAKLVNARAESLPACLLNPQVGLNAAKQPLKILVPFFMHICEAQQGKRMNVENPSKLVDLLESGAPQPAFDHADIRSAGHFGEIFLGYPFHRPELLEALCKGLLCIHGSSHPVGMTNKTH